MQIETFQPEHVASALRIAVHNYEEERRQAPILPEQINFTDLKEFANNGMGFVLMENNKMTGYIGCNKPVNNRVFSPIQAHGAIGNNRAKIYSLLYQNAAKLWVENGIVNHYIALYAHDREGLKSFFWNGFGMYCTDAIRPVATIQCEPIGDCDCIELPFDEINKILPLKHGLISHLSDSPMFLRYPPFSEAQLIEKSRRRKSRLFCVLKNNEIIAFLEITASGENFITFNEKMMNICGGFLKPEYRGSGIYANLLQFVILQLEKEGFTRLGVDFESFNPTARGFWLKYFTPYTKSLARTILA